MSGETLVAQVMTARDNLEARNRNGGLGADTHAVLRAAITVLDRVALAISITRQQPEAGMATCGAAPDHADIMETIENASDTWQKHGYASALAEVRDMANVGRALMEALPEGYSYMNCPSEIVSDLQNERDEAATRLAVPTGVGREEVAHECAARRQGTAGGHDQVDCDWPDCGCDARAPAPTARAEAGTRHTLPAGIDRTILLARQYANVSEDEVGGLPVGHLAAVLRDLSTAVIGKA